MQVGGASLLWAAAQVFTPPQPFVEGRCLGPALLRHLVARCVGGPGLPTSVADAVVSFGLLRSQRLQHCFLLSLPTSVHGRCIYHVGSCA